MSGIMGRGAKYEGAVTDVKCIVRLYCKVRRHCGRGDELLKFRHREIVTANKMLLECGHKTTKEA